MLSCSRTMFGCCNFLHIRASRSNFWKSAFFSISIHFVRLFVRPSARPCRRWWRKKCTEKDYNGNWQRWICNAREVPDPNNFWCKKWEKNKRFNLDLLMRNKCEPSHMTIIIGKKSEERKKVKKIIEQRIKFNFHTFGTHLRWERNARARRTWRSDALFETIITFLIIIITISINVTLFSFRFFLVFVCLFRYYYYFFFSFSRSAPCVSISEI